MVTRILYVLINNHNNWATFPRYQIHLCGLRMKHFL